MTSILTSIVVFILLSGVVWLLVGKNFTRMNYAPSFPNEDVGRPDLFAIFEGRTPCITEDIFKGCQLTKLRLTLFKDPKTNKPTTYKLARVSVGLGNDPYITEGNWAILSDKKTIPDADVYQLDEKTSIEYRWWLTIGKNILLELDQNQNIKVGNAAASYTLSKTR